MSKQPLALGAILYPGFEMLDLFGPLEMFSLVPREQLTIYMIAEQAGPVPAALGMEITGPKVIADYSFNDAPPLDILLLPGGVGTVPELDNERMLDFLAERSKSAKITASVCSGSALLAKRPQYWMAIEPRPINNCSLSLPISLIRSPGLKPHDG